MLSAIQEKLRPDTGNPPHAQSDVDTIADILSNHRRRHTIYHIDTHGTTSISSLAEHIAKHETDTPPVTATERKRVYISLYQSHLKKLDRATIINWHKNRGKIHPASDLAAYSELAAYLEHAADTNGDTQQ